MSDDEEPFSKFAASQFQLLVQAVTDYAIYFLDPTGKIASWNAGAERTKGYLEGEIVGEHFSRFFAEQDRIAGLPDRILRLAAENGRFESEGWRIRKDGTRFWASAVVDAVRDPSGKLLGFAKITRDMTERRAAQVALAESERRLRLLVGSLVDYALYTLSPEGIVLDWNPGASKIKGYAAEEIIGRHFSTFYAPEDRAAGMPQHALTMAKTTGKFETEAWRIRKNGEKFWASVVIDPIYDETGTFVGFVKITRDLSEKKALEEAKEQLFQSQKMETIGQLTGGIAHDFNNLLTGVIGSLQLLRRKAERGQYNEIERYADAAAASADRAAALTHRLLAFSRRQPLDPKVVHANRLLTNMEELLRRAIGEQVEMDFCLSSDLWPTLCDPNQLENAILNLSINARDAMPDGGRLTIATTNAQFDRAQAARLGDFSSGQYVRIAIADTGVGMPPENVARAFEPFFTTKAMGHGTGLGLSMVYGFVRQSGGYAKIYSEPKKGATVEIYLPRSADGPTEFDDPARTETTISGGRGETIVVVEDEHAVRGLVVEVLSELGYHIVEAEDGPSGLRILDGDARIDLLVTDIGLPGLNGIQIAELARMKRPDLKVLLMTGYAENAAAGNGYLRDGMELITKPFTLESLADRVQLLLA